MVDVALAARGPLDEIARPGRFGPPGIEPGVTLSVRPPTAQALVLAHGGQAKTLVDACATRGLALPPPGRAHIARDLTLVAIGPTQWLALSDATGSDLIGSLFAPLSASCSVVRADDARLVIAIAGPKVRDTLAKMLTIDLHPRAFRMGYAAATTTAGMSVILWQVDEAPRLLLAVPRSVAGSFWHWLTDSAAEYGFAVMAAANG